MKANVILVLIISVVLVAGLDSLRASMPVHVPVSTLYASDLSVIPHWLGGYFVTTSTPTTWNLPLTYSSGGDTYPGQFLYIRNYGPAALTLNATNPETINGLNVFIILADSVVQFLSNVDWISVTPGASDIINADNVTIDCWLAVGTVNPANKQCGDFTATRGFVGVDAGRLNTGVESLLWGLRSGEYNSGNNLVAVGEESGQNNTGGNVNNLGYRSGRVNTGISVNNFGFVAGERNTGTAVNNLGEAAGRANTGNFANNIGSNAGEYNTGIASVNIGWEAGQYGAGFASTNIAYRAGRNNTGSFTCHNGYEAGVLNTFNYCFTNGRESVCSMSNQFQIGSTTYPMTVVAQSSASYCLTTDTCLARAAANVWTFGASTSLRVPQYLGVGSSSAPTNTVAGAISTTKATPTLQAFGAVVANAASGLLSFTVSTAAVTCTTAVVTNTNVVAGSEVILTIQSYTGTRFTNGFPVVERADTSGSSAGSFTLNLCNSHATNALSGNLFIAFWVLN